MAPFTPYWERRVQHVGGRALLGDSEPNRTLAYRLGRLHGRVTAELTDRYGEQPGPSMPLEVALVRYEYEQGRADGIEQYNIDWGIS